MAIDSSDNFKEQATAKPVNSDMARVQKLKKLVWSGIQYHCGIHDSAQEINPDDRSLLQVCEAVTELGVATTAVAVAKGVAIDMLQRDDQAKAAAAYSDIA